MILLLRLEELEKTDAELRLSCFFFMVSSVFQVSLLTLPSLSIFSLK